MPKSGNFQPRKKIRSIRGDAIDVADWSTVEPEILSRAINAATFCGGALRFGYSSDGGAYAVGVYFNGDSWTEFVKPSEDIANFMEQVVDWYEGAAKARENDLKAAQNGQVKR